jgi:hypothetical protein
MNVMNTTLSANNELTIVSILAKTRSLNLLSNATNLTLQHIIKRKKLILSPAVELRKVNNAIHGTCIASKHEISRTVFV